jgi:hypothetical protein
MAQVESTYVCDLSSGLIGYLCASLYIGVGVLSSAIAEG